MICKSSCTGRLVSSGDDSNWQSLAHGKLLLIVWRLLVYQGDPSQALSEKPSPQVSQLSQCITQYILALVFVIGSPQVQIENEDVNMPPANKLMVSSHSDTIEGNAVRILMCTLI